MPLKSKDVPENVSTYQQDYSNLSRFEDNSVDVMYAFETIVHNTDKEKILRRPRLARLKFRLFSQQITSNIIMGYLGYDTGNAGVIYYVEWVLRK